MAYISEQYVITATATKLTTALGFTAKVYCQQIQIKNAAGGTAKLYIGDSTVTNVPANAGAELSAGETWTKYPSETRTVSSDEVYLVGTANAANIAFITVIT